MHSLPLGTKMSSHSAHGTRRPRRNAVSEVPFAGRIGGFQQEVVDDEKNREILKNQPDAVRPPSGSSFNPSRMCSILMTPDSPLLSP